MFRFLMVGAVVLAPFGATPVYARQNKVVTQIKVDKSFGDFDIMWDSRKTSYKGKLLITVDKGIILICGVGAFTDAQYRSATTDILRKYRIEMNGKEILRDFRFFTKARTARKVMTTPANCASTGVRVPKRQPKFTLSTGKGSNSYRID